MLGWQMFWPQVKSSKAACFACAATSGSSCTQSRFRIQSINGFLCILSILHVEALTISMQRGRRQGRQKRRSRCRRARDRRGAGTSQTARRARRAVIRVTQVSEHGACSSNGAASTSASLHWRTSLLPWRGATRDHAVWRPFALAC
jgi:hypothetical protein